MTISIGPAATPAEAAAIAAVVQRFGTDTAVALPAAGEGISPWLKAALAEGVTAKDAFGQGDPSGIG